MPTLESAISIHLLPRQQLVLRVHGGLHRSTRRYDCCGTNEDRLISRDQHKTAFPSIFASHEHLEKRRKWIIAWISTYTYPFLPTKGCNSHLAVYAPTGLGITHPSFNEVRVRAKIMYRRMRYSAKCIAQNTFFSPRQSVVCSAINALTLSSIWKEL